MNINQTAIATLDNAIANHPFHPKGIKVGPELMKALREENCITEKHDGPYYNDIYISHDYELNDFGYGLPNSE